MKQLQLPKMSTDKPSVSGRHSENANCCNHLQQNFNQKAPGLVWVSDITYISAGGKWYYLCIIMDLYSRKVISWHISANADAELVITAFQRAYKKTEGSLRADVPFRPGNPVVLPVCPYTSPAPLQSLCLPAGVALCTLFPTLQLHQKS